MVYETGATARPRENRIEAKPGVAIEARVYVLHLGIFWEALLTN